MLTISDRAHADVNLNSVDTLLMDPIIVLVRN